MQTMDWPRFRRLVRGFLLSSGHLVTALCGALLFLHLFGMVLLQTDGLTLGVRIEPALTGVTTLEIPPLGTIQAHTHRAPAELLVRLDHIETETLAKRLANQEERRQAMRTFEAEIQPRLTGFAVREIVLAALGAFAVSLLIWRRGLRPALLLGACGAVMVGGVFFMMLRTYNPAAFREPTYTGTLALAPDVISLAGELWERGGDLPAATGNVVNSIRSLYSRVEDIPVLANPDQKTGTRRILLVSDLHANPVGITLMNSVARKFRVDLIVNAGDLTDYGTKLETPFIQSLVETGIQQLFAAGNHDKADTLNYLKQLSSVRMLNGKTITTKGIRVFGLPDPAIAFPTPAVNSKAYLDGLELQEQSVRALLEDNSARPDLIVVHNPRLGKRLDGLAPVVVSGHTHRLGISRLHESVLINPGTTGAAGLRGFSTDSGVDYSLAILTVQPGQGPVAVDFLSYNPANGDFALTRHLLGPHTDSGQKEDEPSLK